MVSLQHDPHNTTTQALVAISFAEILELFGCEVTGTVVLRGPSLAAVVGLELPDLLEVFFGPFFAAGDHLFTVLLVVGTLVRGHADVIGLRPGFLVFGDLLFVLFLVFPACFDTMRQVGPRPLVFGVLLAVATIVVPRPCFDAGLAVVQVTIRHPGAPIEP
jgi:hypothetical protein